MSAVTEPPLTFKGYFRNIKEAIVSTAKGMAITLKYVYGVKPVTVEYPEVKEVLPENSRSRLYNDVENCISLTALILVETGDPYTSLNLSCSSASDSGFLNPRAQ